MVTRIRVAATFRPCHFGRVFFLRTLSCGVGVYNTLGSKMLYFEVVLVVLLMLVLRVYRLRGGLCYKIIQPHLQEIATMKFLNLKSM